jgi:hypothetical protein
MTPELRAKLLAGLADGSIVPYLGPGVLADVNLARDGRADAGDQRRADPGDEQRQADGAEADVRVSARGDERRTEARPERRHALPDTTYGETQWTRGALHDWLKGSRRRTM